MQHFVVSVFVYVKQWKSENCIQIARAAKRRSQQLKFKTQKCSRINNSKNLIKKKCRSTAPENVSVCCAFISISMELHFDNKNDNDIYCLLFIRFRWMRPFHCIHVCVYSFLAGFGRYALCTNTCHYRRNDFCSDRKWYRIFRERWMETKRNK